MLKSLYSVRDDKAEFFEAPRIAFNDADAIRGFGQMMCHVEPYKNQSEDYSLFKVGEFDESTGKISATDPVHVSSGSVARDIARNAEGTPLQAVQ